MGANIKKIDASNHFGTAFVRDNTILYRKSINLSMFRSACLFLLLCFGISPSLNGQSNFEFTHGKKKTKIRFTLVNNLILIPVQINGYPLQFILDSGVNYSLLFSNEKVRSLPFEDKKSFQLKGLGTNKPIDAYRVLANTFRVRNMISHKHEILLIPEEEYVFSKRMGTQIDGILGYSFFQDHVVEIDYKRKVLTVALSEEKMKRKPKGVTLPIALHQRKPFIPIKVQLNDSTQVEGNVLLDSGSSDALWLFEGVHGIKKKAPFFKDFLGTGINGDIFGHRGKVEQVVLSNYSMQEVKVAYPDTTAFQKIKFIDNRIGSIGGEFLSRFKVQINYPERELYLHPNRGSQKPFYYNLSGMELGFDGVRLVKEQMSPIRRRSIADNDESGGVEVYLNQRYQLKLYQSIAVIQIRPDSPAEKAGLKIGDVITHINKKSLHHLPLSEVIAKLQTHPKDKIRISYLRGGKSFRTLIVLEKLF